MTVGALDVARDFSDVRDVVRGYTLAITQGEPGEVYNLGAGQAFTVRALLDTLIQYSGRADRGRPGGSCPLCARLTSRPSWPTVPSSGRGWAGSPRSGSSRACTTCWHDWREQVRTGAGDPTPLGLRIQRKRVIGGARDFFRGER